MILTALPIYRINNHEVGIKEAGEELLFVDHRETDITSHPSLKLAYTIPIVSPFKALDN